MTSQPLPSPPSRKQPPGHTCTPMRDSCVTALCSVRVDVGSRAICRNSGRKRLPPAEPRGLFDEKAALLQLRDSHSRRKHTQGEVAGVQGQPSQLPSRLRRPVDPAPLGTGGHKESVGVAPAGPPLRASPQQGHSLPPPRPPAHELRPPPPELRPPARDEGLQPSRGLSGRRPALQRRTNLNTGDRKALWERDALQIAASTEVTTEAERSRDGPGGLLALPALGGLLRGAAAPGSSATSGRRGRGPRCRLCESRSALPSAAAPGRVSKQAEPPAPPRTHLGCSLTRVRFARLRTQGRSASGLRTGRKSEGVRMHRPGPTSKTERRSRGKAPVGPARGRPRPTPLLQPAAHGRRGSPLTDRPETGPEPGRPRSLKEPPGGWMEPSPSPPTRSPGPADAAPCLSGRAVGTATGPPRDRHGQKVFRLSLQLNRDILYLFIVTIKYWAFFLCLYFFFF